MDKKLKVGDMVTRFTNYGVVSIHAIERVTATQAIFTIKGNFNKVVRLIIDINSNGYLREISAEKFSTYRYRLALESDHEEAKYKTALLAIENCNWHKIERSILYQIVDLINN